MNLFMARNLLKKLSEAGFQNSTYKELTFGVATIYKAFKL